MLGGISVARLYAVLGGISVARLYAVLGGALELGL